MNLRERGTEDVRGRLTGDGWAVHVWAGASLVETVRPPAGARPDASRRCPISAPAPRPPDRSGSAVVGYSDGSRRGLKGHLDKLARLAVPVFGTLTTSDGPDGPPGPAEVETMRRGLFDALRKRPEYAGVGVVWLREWERRGEGACAGRWAAHLHLLTTSTGGPAAVWRPSAAP